MHGAPRRWLLVGGVSSVPRRRCGRGCPADGVSAATSRPAAARSCGRAPGHDRAHPRSRLETTQGSAGGRSNHDRFPRRLRKPVSPQATRSFVVRSGRVRLGHGYARFPLANRERGHRTGRHFANFMLPLPNQSFGARRSTRSRTSAVRVRMRRRAPSARAQASAVTEPERSIPGTHRRGAAAWLYGRAPQSALGSSK